MGWRVVVVVCVCVWGGDQCVDWWCVLADWCVLWAADLLLVVVAVVAVVVVAVLVAVAAAAAACHVFCSTHRGSIPPPLTHPRLLAP